MQADPIAAIEQRRPRPTASLRRLVCCGAGGIAVEFALLLPVLVFTMIGLYDFARVVGEDGRITSAALAGVHYGMQDTAHAADTPGIIQAVRRDAKDSASDLSVTTQQTCTCGDGASFLRFPVRHDRQANHACSGPRCPDHSERWSPTPSSRTPSP